MARTVHETAPAEPRRDEGPSGGGARERSGGPRGWVARLVRACLEFRGLVVLILGASVVTIAGVVAGPLLARQGVNDALAGRTQGIWWLGAALLGIAVVDFLGDYLRRYGAGRLSLRVQHALRGRVFDSIQRLDGQAQDSLRAGQVVSRTNSDLQQVQTMLQMSPVPVAVLTYYVLGLAAMLWLSPSLTLIAVAVVLLLGLTALRARRRVFAASARAQHDVGEVTEYVRSTVAGISVVKSFLQESRHAREVESACRTLFSRRMATARAQAAPGATMLALPMLGQATLLLVGGGQVMAGTLDLGTFVAFSAYLSMLTGPTRTLASFLVIAQRTRSSAERIFELTDARPEVHDGEEDVPESAPVVLDHVSFGYTSDAPVLSDVDFTVHPGETVAVIGASGSGTSTLSLLLARFYDVLGGAIRIGGRDLRDLRLARLREAVGVVFEDPFLFQGTLRENIAYGHPGATDEQIRAAGRAAGAEEFVSRLSAGYDAQVGEGGRNFSGGQRQRIALARALLGAPGLLVVDDATSSVDAGTEAEIHRALKAYARPAGEHGPARSTLLIARRRSTVELADRIVVLHEGRTVGAGTWEELAAECAPFRMLVEGTGEELGTGTGQRELWPRPERDHGAGQDLQESPERSAPTDADPLGPGSPGPGSPATSRGPRGLRGLWGRVGSSLLELPTGMVRTATGPRVDRVVHLLRPVRRMFAAALGLIVLSALANLLVPVLVQRGIDHGIAAQRPGVLLACALGAFALIGADWLLFIGHHLLSARASEAVQYGVRVRGFRQVLGFGLPYFERERGGQVLTRLTVDVDSMARFLQNGLVNAVMALLSMLGIGVAMLIFSPPLALIALSPLPLVAVATVVFRRLSGRAYDQARAEIGKVNSTLQENISGLRTVQAHGGQSAASSVFRHLSERYRISRERAQRMIALYFPFVVLCSQLSQALVLVFGASWVAQGRLSPGVLAVFLLFMNQFFAPIQQLATIVDAYQQARVGQQRTDALWSQPCPEAEALQDDERTVPLPKAAPAVQVRQVSYRHEGAEGPALREVSMEVPPGGSLALVGTTGAGKTTLLKIMAGLYAPSSGSVLLDGKDMTAAGPRAQRARCGVVAQEPYLFDASIAENIRYARPEASDAEVEEAARAVGALPLLRRLDGGFHHRVSAGGADLGAGLRQLLALARAHLAGPRVLLLDEATAQLDLRSETAVMDTVRDPRRSVVVVAHRLSTARRCDRIAVLERGCVVQAGTHEELLEAGGRYRRLWEGLADTGAR